MSLSEVGVKLIADGQDTFVAALDRAKDAVNTLTESAKGGFGFTEATTAADVLTTAIGVGLYDAVKEAAGWLYDLGKQAFDTVADFERTTQSITAMIAIEKSMGTTVETVSKGIHELSKKELEDIDKKKTALLKNHVAQKGFLESIEKLKSKDTEGKGNANLDLQVKLLEDAQKAGAKLGDEISELQGRAGQEFDIITKTQVDTIDDMSEAMRLAKEPADEILDTLTRLALQSPFERGPILATMKQAQSFGFTSKEAMKMTDTFLKFATVTGRTSGHITRLGYAMGQMKAQGKIMTRQLRQMNMAGLGMDQMAASMGMSVTDFTSAVSKGKIPFDEFNANLDKFISAKYTPAFNEINESFFGLQNAISDISKLSLAAFTEGTLEAGKDILVQFVRPFTQGDALAAIQGFGDAIGKTLEPGLKKVADIVKIAMDGFITLSNLVQGGKPNKEEKKAKDGLEEIGKIQGELKTAMDKTAKGGISSDRAFADLAATLNFANEAAGGFKDEGILLADSIKRAKGDVSDLNILFKGEKDRLDKLQKAGKDTSAEFKQLAEQHKETGRTITLTNDALKLQEADLIKNTAAGKANDAVLATTKTSMDALTKAGKTLSPEYQQLLIDKKLLEDAGRKEGLNYAEITGRMKDMEDATTNYVDNSMSLKTTAVVAQELTDKLEAAKDKGKEMRDGFNPGGAKQTTFLDKVLEAYKEFLPASSPIVDILKGLEALFYKIKGKIEKAMKAMGDFGKEGGKSGLTNILEILADALVWVNTNFETIWRVGKEVVGVLVGLAVFNRIAGFASAAASALGLFLTPLGLIVLAVVGVQEAYRKNLGGTTKYIDDHKKKLDNWWDRTKEIFDKSTFQGQEFERNWKISFAGVQTLFNNGFDTTIAADKAIEKMREIDTNGFSAVKLGIQGILTQFGFLPSTAQTIAGLLVAPIEKIKTVFNGIWIAIKTGVVDKFRNFWAAEPGSAEAKTAGESIKTSILAAFPKSWELPITIAIDVVVRAIDLIKVAWDLVKAAFDKVVTAAGPVFDFLVKHKDAIVPVTEKVLLLVAAMWALDAAMMSVVGFGVVNAITGIAPASVQGIENMKKFRPGGGGAAEGAGGVVDTVTGSFKKGGIFAAQDLAWLKDARIEAGQLEIVMKSFDDDLAALIAKGPDLFDVKEFDKAVKALQQMSGDAVISDDIILQLKANFALTGEAAELAAARHAAALKPLEVGLRNATREAAELGAGIAKQEAIATNVFGRMKDVAKSKLDEIGAGFTKLTGETKLTMGSMDETIAAAFSKPTVVGENFWSGVYNKLWATPPPLPDYSKAALTAIDDMGLFKLLPTDGARAARELVPSFLQEAKALASAAGKAETMAPALGGFAGKAVGAVKTGASTLIGGTEGAAAAGNAIKSFTGIFTEAIPTAIAKATTLTTGGLGIMGNSISTFFTTFGTNIVTGIKLLFTGPSGWATIIKAVGTGIAGIGALFTGAAGATGLSSMIALAFTAPFAVVVETFTMLFTFASFIFGAVATAIVSPVAWAVALISTMVLAFVWMFYNNIAGVTDLIMETFGLIMVPIYGLWNAFLAFNEAINVAMASIGERIMAVWEESIKPTFTKFAEGVAVLIGWLNWLIAPFVYIYYFIFKVLAPIFAIVLYGAIMIVWYGIEILIRIFMWIIDIILAVFQAIYNLIKIVFAVVGAIWDWIDSVLGITDKFKALMSKLSGPGTGSAFKTLISWVTWAANKFNEFTAVIGTVLDSLGKLSGFLQYNWVGYGAAYMMGDGALEKFISENGEAPSMAVEWRKPVVITETAMAAAVEGLWNDLTGDTVRKPTGDETGLEALWLTATNMMKSKDAKDKFAASEASKQTSDAMAAKDKKMADDAAAKTAFNLDAMTEQAKRQAVFDAKNPTLPYSDPTNSNNASKRAASYSVMSQGGASGRVAAPSGSYINNRSNNTTTNFGPMSTEVNLTASFKPDASVGTTIGAMANAAIAVNKKNTQSMTQSLIDQNQARLSPAAAMGGNQ